MKLGRDTRTSKSSESQNRQGCLFDWSFPTQDRARAEAVNKRLRRQLAEFRAPQVILYVREKILTGDLEKTVKMWERKVEIAEVSLREPQDGQPFTSFAFLPRVSFFKLSEPVFGQVMSERDTGQSLQVFKENEGFSFFQVPFSVLGTGRDSVVIVCFSCLFSQ